MADTALESRTERLAKPLFLATILLGSFLLFLTQPMIARMALPRVGGAPAVWNSAMLVFQALLLAGYAYAHWLARLKPRLQCGIHILAFAVAALWLPIGLVPTILPTHAYPALWVPWFLLSSMGPLFFVVSAQAPLMQRWYALESARGDPYSLYAASNLGSFAGLISYPLLVEPSLTLRQQSLIWTGGYILLVLLVAACALTVPRGGQIIEEVPESPAPSRRTIFGWILLAAVPSGLMLSTTTHLTTDIVAIPMLWVLPLGIYLLSFVVAFSNRRDATDFITQVAPLIILISGGLAFANGSQHPMFWATLGLSLLFVISVSLHGEMYRRRPPPDRLTAFYLSMAAGGVLGGIFCAVVAPAVFDWAYEHPLLILAAALLAPQTPLFPFIERLWSGARRRWFAIAIPIVALALSLVVSGPLHLVSGAAALAGSAVIALLAVFSIGQRVTYTICLAALMLSYGGWWTVDISLAWHTRTRSYFAIYSINRSEDGTATTLINGTTLHGLQNLAPRHRLDPTTYYAPRSGVGLAMGAAEVIYGPKARIGVVGLGSGTLSCYALPEQRWQFFEIDPAIVRIATQSGYFTFIRSCAPTAKIVLGDARLSLVRTPSASLDILALDAFSSDAVPMHLLTREAFAVYGRVLQPKGLLLVHISNRYVDLEPVVAAAAKAGGWKAVARDYVPSLEEMAGNATASSWIALSKDQLALDDLVDSSGMEGTWRELHGRPGFAGWSDDYASILPLLKPDALIPYANRGSR